MVIQRDGVRALDKLSNDIELVILLRLVHLHSGTSALC